MKVLIISFVCFIFSYSLTAQKINIASSGRLIAGMHHSDLKDNYVIANNSFKTFYLEDSKFSGLLWDIAIGTGLTIDYGLIQIHTGYYYNWKAYSIKTTIVLSPDTQIEKVNTGVTQDEFEIPLTIGITFLRKYPIRPTIDCGVNYNIFLSAQEDTRSVHGRIYNGKLYGKNELELNLGAGIRLSKWMLTVRHYFGSKSHLGRMQHTSLMLNTYVFDNRSKVKVNVGEL